MAIGDNVEQEDGHTSNLRKEPLQPSTSANDVHPSAAVAALHREGCPCSPPRGGLRPPARGSRSPAVAAACSPVEDGHTSISSKEALPPSTYTKGRRVSSRVLQAVCLAIPCHPDHPPLPSHRFLKAVCLGSRTCSLLAGSNLGHL
ncbi:uncharacterized protein LOC120663044 [Panicum virgatum]|uniref:uncharacterized protein LOC120663044 n=1 Tax=Panicum virgatum TaxID=38727 RepID=UPI0019D5E412|nr:uncharacterized protein LOC120663044 [Panicum virgatum]